MTEEGLRVGQLVRSKAGRDAGSFFLIVGLGERQTVMVADGRLRRVGRPKKKNVRHLEVFPIRVEAAEVRFAPSEVVTDRTVAETIDKLLAQSGLATLSTAAKRDSDRPADAGGGETPEEDIGPYAQEGRD